MTEDTSPENLRKFLKSDDPAMRRMGVSMAKGIGVPRELLPTILGLYMWDDDQIVREAAKTVFTMYAPAKLQAEVKKKWHHSYRKLSENYYTCCVHGSCYHSYKDKFMVVIPPLLQSRDIIAMPLLYYLLKHHQPKPSTPRTERSNSSHVFSKLGAYRGKPILQPLLIKILDDKSAEIRYKATDALRWAYTSTQGYVHNKPAVGKHLIKALEDENKDVRRIASVGLGETFGSYINHGAGRACNRAVESLIKALEDKSEEVRKAVVEALGMIEDKRAEEPLIKALEDKSIEFRAEVVWALGKLTRRGDPRNKVRNSRAVEPLIKLLEDDEPLVGFHSLVAKALAMIGDKRAVPSITKSGTLWCTKRGVFRHVQAEIQVHPLLRKHLYFHSGSVSCICNSTMDVLKRSFGVYGLIGIIDMGHGMTLSGDELKRCLKEKKMPTSGTKSVLLQRLDQDRSPTKKEV